MLKFKRLGLLSLFYFASIVCVMGQGEVPCSGDPDDPGYDPNGCPVPLDTWLIFLIFAAVGFAAWYLHKNQRRFFIQ